MRQRGFEIISEYEDKEINLPQRKTFASAGYDIEAAEDIELLPQKMTVVKTGLKAYMQNDEYLGIHIRSSMAMKQQLMLMNSQGIIDADYYNNADNEGHIMIAFWNHGSKSVQITKGTRIAQGIFYKYLITDDDAADESAVRTGGIGSTGAR